MIETMQYRQSVGKLDIIFPLSIKKFDHLVGIIRSRRESEVQC